MTNNKMTRLRPAAHANAKEMAEKDNRPIAAVVEDAVVELYDRWIEERKRKERQNDD